MKKYPVIGTDGTIYEARISESQGDIFLDAHIEVSLYEVTEKITWFGNKKRVIRGMFSSKFFENDSEYYDYVSAIKEAVKRYENSNSYKKMKSWKTNLEKLANWDGKVEED